MIVSVLTVGIRTTIKYSGILTESQISKLETGLSIGYREEVKSKISNIQEEKQMAAENDQHYEELLILKTIAETLNESDSMKEMLQSTLEKLLELTQLEAGWIFLAEDEPEYEHIADHNLPPALARDNKAPMRESVCYCLGLYWSGQLSQAVNIIECERLHNAVKYAEGDTHNLTHHATVPITVRGERLGVLNVGSPGKEHFNEEELALLESIALQIGTAVERTRLYEQKEKQAVDHMSRYIVDYYTSANEVTRYIWKVTDWDKLLTSIVEQISVHFGWPESAVILKQENGLRLRSSYHRGSPHLMDKPLSLEDEEMVKALLTRSAEEQCICFNEGNDPILSFMKQSPYSAGLPLKVRDIHEEYYRIGMLFIGRDNEDFNSVELDILEVLADHISLVMEKIRLYEEWQGLLLAEERNRLARDLHDSVNQKLFSLSLMSRGLKEMLAKENNSQTWEAAEDIGTLAQNALTEMRTLIWQLRPYGEARGLLRTVTEYAEQLDIRLTMQMKETPSLPKTIEKVFCQIGQEALNNISKHADTNRAWLRIEKKEKEIKMIIMDRGRGFVPEKVNPFNSLGMASMKERASELNGRVDIRSEAGSGTIITVVIPYESGGTYEN